MNAIDQSAVLSCGRLLLIRTVIDMVSFATSKDHRMKLTSAGLKLSTCPTSHGQSRKKALLTMLRKLDGKWPDRMGGSRLILDSRSRQRKTRLATSHNS